MVGAPAPVSGDGTYKGGREGGGSQSGEWRRVGGGVTRRPVSELTQVGTDTWHASCSGDPLNDAAVDNGDNESITSIKASPAVSTQASKTGRRCGRYGHDLGYGDGYWW